MNYQYLSFYRAYPQIVRTLPAQFRRLLPRLSSSRKVRTASAPFALAPGRLFGSLSYSHFELLVGVDNPLARAFYEAECVRDHWSVRELKRQIGTLRFQFDDLALARLIGAFMRTPPYFDFVEGSIGGSAQPNASAQVLAGAQFAVPTREIAWRFSELVGPLDRCMVANNDESRTLTALRDALLPKLLSGEIRITAAEKVIGEVA